MKNFLEKAHTLYSKYSTHGWYEQAAIMELIYTNYMDICSGIEYIPSYIWNSYDKDVLSFSPQNYTNDESFILHLPSIQNTTRLSTFQKYIEIKYDKA